MDFTVIIFRLHFLNDDNYYCNDEFNLFIRSLSSLLFDFNLYAFLFFSIHFTDKQKIENETKKQMQRDSTIEVLEEQLKLWTAKVNE